MKADFTGTPGVDWQLVEGTYVFSGPPDDCNGELTFVNLSQQPARVRRLETAPMARARRGFRPLASTGVRLRINLAPDSQGSVTAYLQLPPETPPGRYLARLVTGEHKANLDITVATTRMLEPDPEDLELVAMASETVTFGIVLRNRGNVPMEVQRIDPVWLTEDAWRERILVAALQETDDTDDFATFSRRLLDMAREDIPAPAQLHVDPPPGFTLDPGHTRSLSLSLTLPDNLRAGREYTGFIRINGERVGLEVYCSGQPVQHETPPSVTHES